jgi:G3E family GTPase
MKTTVVSGMLGSGKTTFIGHLLKEADERTVVLVNDFGTLGIDGEVFSAAGIEAVELPSGCVCCTLKFDLITTVERIRTTFSPEHLLIEPSGVASPSGVLEALESAGIKRVSVVGIVDATEFLELHEAEMFGAFFRDQIVNADVILVNKVDLAGAELARRTTAVIEAMNPAAIVFRTVQALIEGTLPEARAERGIVAVGHAHFRFDTVSFKIPAGTAVERMEVLMGALAAGRYGKIVRAKALAATNRGPWRFDLAFGNLSAAPFAQPIGDSRMVVIGESLCDAAIRRAVEPAALPKRADTDPAR